METYIINQITKGKQGTTIEVSLGNISKLSVINVNQVNFDLIALASEPRTKVLLNLHGVKFIDSEGFQCLSQLTQLAREHQSSIELMGINPELDELINLVKKHSDIDIKTLPTNQVTTNVA